MHRKLDHGAPVSSQLSTALHNPNLEAAVFDGPMLSVDELAE